MENSVESGDVGVKEENPTSSGEVTFSEVMEIYHDKLDQMLGDSLLSDLRQDITLEEIKSLIALEHGQAMTIKVRKATGEIYPVIVNQNAAVSDLKKAIKLFVQLKQEREDGNTHLSWKYVWKSYWLVFQGEKLKDDSRKLKDYGLHNRDEVVFIKRLKEK